MIGVDIVAISRIDDVIKKFGDRFFSRWFNVSEVAEGMSTYNVAAYFAKRFAAKEAYLKARGHGIGLKFSEICIKKNEHGKPIIFYQDRKLRNTDVSLSDDGNYAIAFVIIFQS